MWNKERTKYGAYEVYNITRGRIVSAVVLLGGNKGRNALVLL
ncbi:hypothetical protein [Paenibacillus sp. FSL H3-0329]